MQDEKGTEDRKKKRNKVSIEFCLCKFYLHTIWLAMRDTCNKGTYDRSQSTLIDVNSDEVTAFALSFVNSVSSSSLFPSSLLL